MLLELEVRAPRWWRHLCTVPGRCRARACFSVPPAMLIERPAQGRAQWRQRRHGAPGGTAASPRAAVCNRHILNAADLDPQGVTAHPVWDRVGVSFLAKAEAPTELKTLSRLLERALMWRVCDGRTASRLRASRMGASRMSTSASRSHAVTYYGYSHSMSECGARHRPTDACRTLCPRFSRRRPTYEAACRTPLFCTQRHARDASD